uniref:Uncharacterized protein n=1 Tax=Panagrolaimus sp. JU765 TaxID=591449 RepID=A0AC34QX66_9BILA
MSTDMLLNQLASSSTTFSNFPGYFENANLETPSTSPSTESTTHQTRISDEQKIENILLPALKGHQALPIHLKLLYDAIFPSYPDYMILDVLSRTDWTMEDFKRGYIQQNWSLDSVSFT